MKKCYHCKSTFVHEGDPVDGNDFCSHVCSGNYIQEVKVLEDVPTSDCPIWKLKETLEKFEGIMNEVSTDENPQQTKELPTKLANTIVASTNRRRFEQWVKIEIGKN